MSEPAGYRLTECMPRNIEGIKLNLVSREIDFIDLSTRSVAHISELNLSYNQIFSLRNIGQFSAVKYLDLSNNQV